MEGAKSVAIHRDVGNDKKVYDGASKTVEKYQPEPKMIPGPSDRVDSNEVESVESARAIVQSILNQITLHDSPLINEEISSPKLERRGAVPFRVTPKSGSRHILVTPKSVSRQQHMLPSPARLPPSDESMSSSDCSTYISVAENNETATQWMAQYKQREKQVEMKMGNVALATLCHRTLECTMPVENQENTAPHRSKPTLTVDTSEHAEKNDWEEEHVDPPFLGDSLTEVYPTIVGRPSPTRRKRYGDPPARECTTQAMHEITINLPTPAAPRELDDIREEFSGNSSPQRGSRLSKNPPLVACRDPTPTYERGVEDGFEDYLPTVESLSTDDSDPGTHDDTLKFLPNFPSSLPSLEYPVKGASDPIHEQRLEALTQVTGVSRLQMFGSEYARFLSETPLAPKHDKPKTPKRSICRSNSRSSLVGRNGVRVYNLEDADEAIVTGAVTDIIITHDATSPPKGYYRISQTLSGDDFGGLERKGPQVHINVKKEVNWDRAAQRPCVTALAVIFPERKEVVPPGFCVVSLYEGTENGKVSKSSGPNPADLNRGSNGERVYLCYRRSREGNPLTGLMPLLPSKCDPIPEGYTVLERSPRNHVADLNSGGTYPVFLAIRQRLASLEPLRPLPLLLSIYHDTMRKYSPPTFQTKPEDPKQRLSAIFRIATLRSYYCTGGTTVAANVGKFHIMDRSTHTLLSPSSIKNRLTLIQASRLKSGSGDGGSTISSTTGLDSSFYLDDNHSLNNTLSGSLEGDSMMGDDGSIGDGSSIYNSSSSTMSRGTFAQQRKPKVALSTLFSNDDIALQHCLNATAFIPIVETPLCEQAEPGMTLETRIAIITPILTACYTQHGGAAMLAVQGLLSLLNKTNFFRPDLVVFPEGGGSESRLTLLDIAIQSVCDIATSTARETSFVDCIEFVKKAVRFAEGHLNTRTIGYVLRFYLFVFYFGASVPTSSTAQNTVWTALSHYGSTTRSAVAAADVPFLFEAGRSDYLPGGAPQAAALALKDLVSILMNRLVVLSYAERMRLAHEVKESASESDDEDEDPLGSFVNGVITSLVDNAVRRVDLANVSQLALHQIHRSGGSELFWYDMMNTCGNGLFGSIDNLRAEGRSVHMIAFSLLANMVKVSSGRMRQVASTGSLIPRDVASKLLSLEMLNHYMTSFRHCVVKASLLDGPEAAEHQRESSETLIYAMRRLVVPCLLTNTIQGLQDARVFRRVIHIISEAWKVPMFRKRMKVELGVVIDQFALRLLNLGPQLLPPEQMHMSNQAGSDSIQPLDSALQIFVEPLFNQQVDILFEINRWFQGDARSLVEFFLNFDTDISLQSEGSNHWMPAGNQSKLCERLCGSICLVAEQSGNVIANQIKESHATNEGPLTPTSASSSDFSFKATHRNGKDKDKKDTKKEAEAVIVAARLAARQLQSGSFTAAAQIARCLAVAAATSLGREAAQIVARNHSKEKEIKIDDDAYEPFAHDDPDSSATGTDTIMAYWRTAITDKRTAGAASRRNAHQTARQSLPDNRTFNEVGTEWDNSSVGTECTIDDTLRAAFDIVETKSLKKGIEYLIEQQFLTPAARDVATFLRVHHTRLNSRSLGEYLGEGGVDYAGIEYLNLVRFNYVRAISFVGMTVEQGLRHFLTNCGFRLPGEAQQIDRVMTTFSQCYWEDNAGDYYRCPFDDQDTVFLLSFAIIMLNTDLHKVSLKSKCRSQRKKMTKPEFLNNLRDVARDDELSHEYLSIIYDSVEASPIELFEESILPVLEITTSSGVSDVMTEQRNLGKNLKSMVKNVKKSEELLRGLSVHEFRFYTIEDYADYMPCSNMEALLEISHSAFTSTWNHFHGLIKATINIAHLDPQALVLCLPILRHCLCATICMDMMKEFKEFSHQLARVKMFAEKSTVAAPSYQMESWFSDLQASLEIGDKMTALEQIQELIENLEERLKVDSQARKHIIRVVRRIREGQFLLQDPGRSFCKEGHLLKKSHRLGRNTAYHFFLFSDLLVYAKPASVAPGEELYFNIHEVLSLPLMKVVDWYPNGKKQTDKNFTIHHPRKSFTVVCATVQERKDWVAAISRGIRVVHRRMALNEEARKNMEAPQEPQPDSCV